MVSVADRICRARQVNGSSIHEIRQAFQYFSGNRSRAFTTDIDYGGMLWNAIKEHASDQSILRIIETEDSPSGGLVNLMEQYLTPFRGTHSATKQASGHRGRRDNKSVLLSALLKSSKVQGDLIDILQRGLLKRDLYTCNITMALWSHRCFFLKAFGSNSLDEGTIQESLGGATTVEACLLAMQDDIDEFLKDRKGVNVSDMYNILIGAWTNSGLHRNIERVQEILDKMEADPSLSPDIVTYNSILHAYSQRAESDSTCLHRASQLFRRMKEKGKVDVVSYSTLILAHSKAGLNLKSEEILDQMELSAKETGIYPNDICYNTLLDAYSREGTVEAAQRAEALVERMTQMSESGKNKHASPDRVSYTSVIKAWRNSESRNAAERAEAILFRCQELAHDNSVLKPDAVMFNTVLSVWAKFSEINRGSEIGAQRADRLLSQMKLDFQTKPDTISYNSVMQAWSKSDSPNAATRVLELLEEMKSSDHRKCKPDHRTCNTILMTLSKSREGDSVKLVEDFLVEMKKDGIPPTVFQYNVLMSTIVAADVDNASTRVEGILQMMEEAFQKGNSDMGPNMHSYNIAMNAYSKSEDPDASKKIDAILRRMPGFNGISTTMGLNTLIDAHARAGRADAAESVLRDMLKIPELRVENVSFNTVINAYAKSNDPDAPLRAEALLGEMYDAFEAGNLAVKPDAVTFSSVINCWARSKRIGAAERAESILNRMDELSKHGHNNLAPTAIAYSTTMNAWARSGLDEAPTRAKALLNRMEEAHASGKLEAKPSHFCYNAVLNAIAKGNDENKVSDAISMLGRMKQAFLDGNHDAKPTSTSYATVLNACAFIRGTPEEKLESFNTARQIFRELLQSDYCEPNMVTYVNFMSCCGILLPQGDDRTNIACSIFRHSYQRGMMHEKLISGFRRSVAPETFRREMNEMTNYMRRSESQV